EVGCGGEDFRLGALHRHMVTRQQHAMLRADEEVGGGNVRSEGAAADAHRSEFGKIVQGSGAEGAAADPTDRPEAVVPGQDHVSDTERLDGDRAGLRRDTGARPEAGRMRTPARSARTGAATLHSVRSPAAHDRRSTLAMSTTGFLAQEIAES